MSELKTFSNGETQEYELIPGGKDIEVNDNNKAQYIS